MARKKTTNEFSDMPITARVKEYLDPKDLGFQIAWEDDRSVAQFSAEIMFEDVETNIFIDINESEKLISFYSYFKSFPRIPKKSLTLLSTAIDLVNSQISGGRFFLLGDDNPTIQFAFQILCSDRDVDEDDLDQGLGGAAGNMGTYYDYFKSVIKGRITPEEGLRSNIIFLQLRQEVELSFSNIEDAKRFLKKPHIEISFNPIESNDSNEKLLLQPLKDFPRALKKDNYAISQDGSKCFCKFVYTFAASIRLGQTIGDLEEWISDEGGIYTFRFDIEDPECEFGDGETYLGKFNEWGFEVDSDLVDE